FDAFRYGAELGDQYDTPTLPSRATYVTIHGAGNMTNIQLGIGNTSTMYHDHTGAPSDVYNASQLDKTVILAK
ncbi:MAG: hypothetical protein LBV53_01170, partial [Mycoplasmataceae bacterium]|nr:hypothetical protein [Mycoplasmataceae bacterium]